MRALPRETEITARQARNALTPLVLFAERIFMSIAHFQKSCQALINLTVEALATSPHLTPAQRKVRSDAVVCAIMAFLPTEPLQVMLASQAAGHHLSVLDTFQQILNRALADGISVKMRAISIGETRTMLALTRELRRVRKEMIAIAEAERDTMAVRPIAASEPRPEPPVEAPPFEAPLAEAPLAPQPSAVPPPSLAGIRHAAAAADDPKFAAHIADFENAMTAVQQTLEEARALDKRTATRANGHLAAVTPSGLAAARLSASG